MADDWQMFPPISLDLNSISPESSINNNFAITNQSNKFENVVSFEWSGLSRQELATVSNLKQSGELKQLLLSYNYGISWGTAVDMIAKEDPHDAQCGFSIHSKNEITEASLQEIVRLIREYRV